MKKFLCDEFLLHSKTAVRLYEDYAKNLPIIDYHSHVPAAEILEDKHFKNLTELWLSHDHYKWRIMRARGVPEELVTGANTDAFDRFKAFCAALPYAMGNPVYHFSHLELKRYFDCDLIINAENAKAIWDSCNEKLSDLSVREIIRRSNAEVICTTDDPLTDLSCHKKLSEYAVKVLPSFRPDNAYNIEKPGWNDYIDALGPHNVDELKQALKKRVKDFAEAGCRIADHGVDALFEGCCDDKTAELIFVKARKKEAVTANEANLFRKNIMAFLCDCYHKNDMTNLIHVGVKRNVNSRQLTADTGFDVINPAPSLAGLVDLLDKCSPLRTIVFSLNPNDNALVNTIAGSFKNTVQGPAWWFNDTEDGIRRQLTDMAAYGVLGNFPGMVTDSRSFLSYSRHEYFRRILCDTVGTWVEEGLYPNDEKFLGEFIADLCYGNAKKLFER
ncbi:MAG: glucuronate isomerase [Ruminococcus sp.]|jgi:glucuronate isomerase|nr:glucuronate isomerase [Ruminococcus sp.]